MTLRSAFIDQLQISTGLNWHIELFKTFFIPTYIVVSMEGESDGVAQ
jgi:hypothetical protein